VTSFSILPKKNPKTAPVLLSEIKERAVLLQDNPLIGRVGRIDETRELVITGPQYILPYRVKENPIQILAVFHAARKWPVSFE
jgi:toxin ParE1/3/4